MPYQKRRYRLPQLAAAGGFNSLPVMVIIHNQYYGYIYNASLYTKPNER